MLDGQLRDSGAFVGAEIDIRSGRSQGSDRIDAGGDKTLEQPRVGSLVDLLVADRGEGEGAQAREQVRRWSVRVRQVVVSVVVVDCR